MQFGTEDDEFRRRVADWLAANVPAELRGAGGPGREHEAFAERLAWNRRLAAAGWTCLGWPAAHGGHRETDLAMLALFGAPHLDVILRAYEQVTRLADGWRDRIALHQLHPLLVHVCLFGASYAGQLRAAARRGCRCPVRSARLAPQ